MAEPLLRIGTRASQLALWQAEHVQALLQQYNPGLRVELVKITTSGDKILDVPLAKVGGKGLFVKEIEEAMLRGEVDIAVHSMKDVPVVLPKPLFLPVILKREDPRDAFVSPGYASLDELPHGAVVGTSSLRRQVLLQALRPDLQIEPLRGNVQTRLRKLDEGQYAAIVLAAAGLKRLGLHERIRAVFTPEQMLPAAGQGALGIEIRGDRHDLREALAPLAHERTWLTVTAERAVSRAMGGSCSMPLAAHGQWDGDTLSLRAAWGDVAARVPLVRAEGAAPVHTLEQADALGLAVAAQLRTAGAVGAL